MKNLFIFIFLLSFGQQRLHAQNFLKRKEEPEKKIVITVEREFYKTNLFQLRHENSIYGIEASYERRSKTLDHMKIFKNGKVEIYFHGRRSKSKLLPIVKAAHAAIRKKNHKLRL